MFFGEVDLKRAELQKVKLPGIEKENEIFMLRLDLIHPEFHGNKFFKMKYNLIEAEREGFKTLLTFGGAFSNHIRATAAAGKIFGFETIGVIRGEEHLPLNPTLSFASANGMKLFYVSRNDYRNKHTVDFQNKLKEKFGNIYILPEGGTNNLAVKGCSEIPGLIKTEFDYLCVACGTAGTLSGIVAGMNGNKKIWGFAVLKNAGFLINNSEELIRNFNGRNFSNWDIVLDYHLGGYAKINIELINYIDEFESLNGIPLDPVYTGKMMFGLREMIRQNRISSHERIVALHTGGVQGKDGMESRIQKLILSRRVI